MKKEKILVINTADLRDAPMGQFDIEGWETIAAKNNEEAISLLKQERPAVVLTGVKTADSPAFLINELRRLNVSGLVIACVSKPDFATAMRWMAEGVFKVIEYPFGQQTLKDALSKALRHLQAFRETTEALTPANENLKLQARLVSYYRGLAGDLNPFSLGRHIVFSMPGLTGALQAELSLSNDFKPTFWEMSPTGTDVCEHKIISANNISTKKLKQKKFELSAEGRYHGELVLYFKVEKKLSDHQFHNFKETLMAATEALNAARNYQKALSLASHDVLTGLYNRRIFQETLNLEFAKAKRYDQTLSLISLDLDHFKEVNDQFGHQAGDLVLKTVADILIQTARKTDIVARLGGDEFIIILPHTNSKQAAILANRLRTKTSTTQIKINDHNFQQTISQGVADLESFSINSPEDMIYLADQALYKAKNEGRNAIYLAENLTSPLVLKEKSLKSAI